MQPASSMEHHLQREGKCGAKLQITTKTFNSHYQQIMPSSTVNVPKVECDTNKLAYQKHDHKGLDQPISDDKIRHAESYSSMRHSIGRRESSLLSSRVTPLSLCARTIQDRHSSFDQQAYQRRLETPPSSTRNETFGKVVLEGCNTSNHSRQCSSPRVENFSKVAAPETPKSMCSMSISSSSEGKSKFRNISRSTSPLHLPRSPPRLDLDVTQNLERMRRKHNCVRELYNTEWQFAQDMAVVVRIYMCGSAELGLSVRQIDQLFSNVSQILDISLSLVAILESHIPTEILQGNGKLHPQDLISDSMLEVGKAMCLALNGQFYEMYENYIRNSKRQMELYFELTKSFNTQPQKQQYMSTSSRQKTSTENIDEKKLINWLERCKQRVNGFTTAWSLDSLLIKPIQRLGKYPLFLLTIMDCTDPGHRDYADLQRALRRSKQYLDCVNARLALNED